MNSDIQTRMLKSVHACLLPLAKLLLRSGITYRQFDAIAKRAFVHQAMAEAESRGRPTNTSRVAVRTGLQDRQHGFFTLGTPIGDSWGATESHSNWTFRMKK